MTQQYPPVNGSTRSDFWFNAGSLQNASSKFLASVTAQFASQYLRKEANATVPGSVIIVEPRLVIFTVAFSFILALLGVLFVIALSLTWCATKSVTPVDPASIGGTIAMICPDGHLIDRFHGTGSRTLPELRNHISGPASSKSAAKKWIFHRTSKKTLRAGPDHNDATWWRPFVFRPPSRAIILLLPLAIVAVLEITLHYSQNHNGLAYIGPHRHRLYASRVVPAIVFFATHKLLNSMAFNVSLMTPFSTLRKRPTVARFNLFDSPLARSPIQNLWFSTKRKQVALFCSVFMMSAAFFLVTVSSGLFVTGSGTRDSDLTQVSWFQFSSSDQDSKIHNVSTRYNLTEPFHYAQDNGEVRVHLVGNSIIELNLSYPVWTYDELAFPLLAISNASGSDATYATSVSARVPAARANLQCEVLKNGDFNLTYDQALGDDGQSLPYKAATLAINGAAPNCSLELPGVPLTLQANLPSRPDSSMEDSLKPRPCAMLSSYCDRLYGIYGYATDGAFVNHSVISCTGSYEQVQATVTFDLPDYIISTKTPPIVDESETKPVDSSDVPSFLEAISYFTAPYNTSETTYNGLAIVDPVSSALIYARGGIPVEQLFQSDPEEYLIPNLKHLIRIMGAQYISYFYRTANASTPLLNSTHSATLQMGPDYRLKQTVVSTRILDALLIASWIFAVIIVISFRSRDVVKAELGSLAATIALVADSDFVSDLQSGIRDNEGEGRKESEGSQEKIFADVMQIEKKLSSGGHQFSLGWWENSQMLSAASNQGNEVERRRWGIDISRSD